MIPRAVKVAITTCAIVALSGCAILSKPPVGNPNVPQPSKSVEIDRYLGRWYELYRYDASFQKDCEAVSADYSRNADGTIRVLNACRKGAVDGDVKTATGKAKIVDTVTGAKLKVSFFGPFYGDYWVLDHADDYQWSIVGEPSGRYLWILSRDPRPDGRLKTMLRRRVEEMGYDWSLMRETMQ
ncbi:MAG: lipocalin family protein [Erythrobacter sp.]|jgi:apolipoprotein D and lipocalin family protein|uniref:lipocalin family protein n=1 Tax=Erythrobacter sp. TaxID=1042 RepID=UPI002B48308C|nr:lipocalin family protein [Erythrobacter sp.]WRH71578.1 MAG: lipocalin family protein [Erythrobacter sp.]